MRQRRHHGATMGLVVICILVIAVLGVGAYFLIKMMGGGREIANATDAGVLNVAKHVIRDARVPTPAGYEDCEYPLGCGYINLLTYNRCVARAIMVASNAENMTGPGSYKANAQKALSDLAAAGRALTQKIVDSNKYFDQVNNSVHMASFVGVKDSGPCALAYMKPNGSTNVFFSDGQINGVSVPVSSGITPKNPLNYAAAPESYMAGYAPIKVLGETIYGVPVFPQQNPHLVSFLDFNSAKSSIGNAPPNAVQLGSNTIEMKTNMLTGAVACAIVGATEFGSAGAGGSTLGTSLLGSGFQFPAAASYGYLEFGNYPANNAPPGYEPMDYKDNIFNHELFTAENFVALGDKPGGSENSNRLAFGVNTNDDVFSLVYWAAGTKKAQSNENANRAVPSPNLPVNYPDFPSTSSIVYAGNQGQVIAIAPGDRAAAMSVIDALAACESMATYNAQVRGGGVFGLQDVCWCTQLLQFKEGLRGACVAALPDMMRVYNHKIPSPNRGAMQDFSQADWAKAKLLTDFEGVDPKNVGGGGYNNQSIVNLTATESSGLGVYPSTLVKGRVPETPDNMPTPQYSLPLQRPGTIYELIRAVQSDGCMKDTIKSITERCKQIQPKTADGDVITLLNTKPMSILPMASHGLAATWQNANKLYIYLPGGDLSQKLVISSVEPSKITHTAPDGCCGSPNMKNACYTNQYNLNGSIVDSDHDQNVDARPYLQINGTLYVIDHADWQPGTGADNNFGRMTFEEIGIGKSTYTQIN